MRLSLAKVTESIQVISLIATVMFALVGCDSKPATVVLSSADSLSIVQDNIAHRLEVETSFRDDPTSPFNRDTTIEFHGLKWFPIDPYYRGKSILHRYDVTDTVIVLGTKGEERKQVRYGYFEFSVPKAGGDFQTIRLNAYKFTPYDTKRYALFKDNLSVWFTDSTTGDESYGVGRYVEVGNELPDKDHIYTIDLNKAFNPYCAYSDLYSCAIPRKEDFLNIALRVGEKNYH